MDLQEELALEIGRVSRHWRTRLDERLKAAGLTQARWYTLLHLSRGGEGMTQRELAERVGIEGPTLVRLLDRLEEQGLIERRTGDDRRVKQIHLTGTAQPILDQINRIAAELRQEIFADMAEDDLAACLRTLRKISGRLEHL